MKRNRVFLIGPPFSGHLHPLLGIGQRLMELADVSVLCTPGGVRAANAAGLSGRSILAEHERAVWAITEPGENVKNHPLLLYRQLKANVALMGMLKAELDAIFATEKPDLVIADFTVPVAGLSAMQQGIPWWTTLPSPCVFEAPDGPPAYCGGQLPSKTWASKFQHAFLRSATRMFKRLMWRLFRQQFRALGFEGIYRADGSEAVYSPAHVFALGVGELEFPRSYPPQFHLVGPVLYTPPCTVLVPEFAQDGRKRVLISIGTHLPHAKAALAATMRDVAERHPDIVFHFTHGQADAVITPLTGNFREFAYISYAEHLPRYDLVVHHAGAGVLNHCLHHGKPAVVHPLDFDQFDNAARLVAAGVALMAKRREDIEAAILRALHDPALHEHCRVMSESCRRYDAAGFIASLASEM